MTPAEIRSLRSRLRLTQTEFGTRLGLRGKPESIKAEVAKWEAGTRLLPPKFELALVKGQIEGVTL